MLRELAADGGANYILRSLPAAELELLRPHLEPVELPLRHLYYAKGARIPAVWFIEKGAASWLVEMKDGTLIEAGTIGREGVEGLPLVLGAEVAPARSVMQVPGNGFRLEASKFRELFPRCPVLQSRLAAYTQCFIVLAAQSAACNRLHELDQRCARWLLMAHDRADREESFYITQDYLAMMLGVRRAGVSQAASALSVPVPLLEAACAGDAVLPTMHQRGLALLVLEVGAEFPELLRLAHRLLSQTEAMLRMESGETACHSLAPVIWR